MMRAKALYSEKVQEVAELQSKIKHIAKVRVLYSTYHNIASHCQVMHLQLHTFNFPHRSNFYWRKIFKKCSNLSTLMDDSVVSSNIFSAIRSLIILLCYFSRIM